jgi:hypothetical protein
MDAAVARLIGEAQPELLGLGGYRGVAEPGPGMLVQKSGRTSGVSEGRVAYTELAIRVGYPFGEALFTGQVGLEPAVLNPGDSGSAIVSRERVVALGFAGSRVLSVATPMGKVMERFGLRLTPPGTPVEEALAPILDSLSVVWGFDNRTKAWRVYDPRAAQGSTLRALRDGHGYWIELHEDAVLTHMGRRQPLYAGWNLVGWRE